MFDGNENTDWYESPKNENVIQIQTIFLLRLILKTLHDDDVFPRLLCIFPVAFFLIPESSNLTQISRPTLLNIEKYLRTI